MSFGLSAAAWGAIALGAGAGATIYGANKQVGAIKDANQANQAAQTQQNNAAWTNWLMSRGIAPNSPVSAGVMPTAGNYTAVNTRLPLWATIPSKPRAAVAPAATLPAAQRWQKIPA